MITLTTENIKRYFNEFQKKFDKISIPQEKVFIFWNKLYSEKELSKHINDICKQEVKKNREKLMKKYFK